jgi:hypothetical protein
MNPQTGTWNVAAGTPAGHPALIFSSEEARSVMVTIRKHDHSPLPILVQVNGGETRSLLDRDIARTFVLPAVKTLHVAAGQAPAGASADGDYAITVLEAPLART